MLYQGSTVNPDSMSLLAGAGTAIVWLRLRAVRGRRAILGLLVVLTLVVWVKPNFIAIPVAVMVTEASLVARRGWRGLFKRTTWTLASPTGRVTLATVCAALLGVALPAVLMHLGTRTGSLGPNSAAWGRAPWNTDAALTGWAKGFGPLIELPKVRIFDHGWLVLLGAVINLLVVTGAVAACFLSTRRGLPEDLVSADGGPPVDSVRALGTLAVVSLVVAAPVTYVLVGAAGSFITYPPRYSLFVVPLGLVALVGLSVSRDPVVGSPPTTNPSNERSEVLLPEPER